MYISKKQENFQKTFMVLKIIVFEIKQLTSFIDDKNACERPSTC